MSPVTLKELIESPTRGESQREFIGSDMLGEVVLYGLLTSRGTNTEVDLIVQDGDRNSPYTKSCDIEHGSPEEVEILMQDFSSSAAEVVTAIVRSRLSDRMIAEKLRFI